MTHTGWSPCTPPPIVMATARAWLLRTAWAALTVPPCAVAASTARAQQFLRASDRTRRLQALTDATAEAGWLDGRAARGRSARGRSRRRRFADDAGWLAASSLDTTIECGDTSASSHSPQRKAQLRQREGPPRGAWPQHSAQPSDVATRPTVPQSANRWNQCWSSANAPASASTARSTSAALITSGGARRIVEP